MTKLKYYHHAGSSLYELAKHTFCRNSSANANMEYEKRDLNVICKVVGKTYFEFTKVFFAKI